MAGKSTRIVLAGGGHGHLGVLHAWAKAPPPDTQRVLVTSGQHTAYSGMLPGWMAGIYTQNQIFVDLAPLAAAAGAALVLAEVSGLAADAGQVQLATGEWLDFDLLSLATGGEIDTAPLAATGARLLPVRAVEAFMAGWQAALAGSRSAAEFDVAVVGGGAGGFELACAAQAALRRKYGAGRVALVAAPGTLLAGHARAVATVGHNALAVRGITLIEAIAAGHPEGLVLPGGRILSAGLVIAATGSRAPGWLAASGLATAEGFVAVDATLASLSHPHIFAAGDIIARQDRPLPRSGIHAVKAGPVLAANLSARLTGAALAEYQPPARNLYLLSTGDCSAILSWGPIGLAGRPVWWLKDWIDRAFMRRQQP